MSACSGCASASSSEISAVVDIAARRRPT
jgi:hypothetical protein